MVAALGAVVTWVFRDHVKQDEKRFDKFASAYSNISEKLDKAVETQAKNHAEILKILLDRKDV